MKRILQIILIPLALLGAVFIIVISVILERWLLKGGDYYD